MSHRAVIFDLGGVVMGSPMDAIARFELECGLPAGFVNRTIVAAGPQGAWARLERGELAMEQFFAAFEADCAAAGRSLSARELMLRMREAGEVRPAMLDAIGRIRARGLRVAALTNNFKTEGGGDIGIEHHFDVFVESSAVGLNKPDPRIYRHTCERLGVEPPEAVFLDDIGRNLKSARQLGMTTIKVEDPERALGELESVLGFPLRSG